MRATGGDHAGTGARGTPKRLPPTAKERRLPKIKERAELWNKARWKEVRSDIENKVRRADLTEAIHIEDWVSELRREGFTDFYAHPIKVGPRAGEMPRGTVRYGQDEFGKVLKDVYYSGGGRGGPDLVAVAHGQPPRILVGDVTAGPWSTAEVPIEFGAEHRHPAVEEVRAEVERPAHMVKTQRDANRLASRAPENFPGYSVDFQEYWYEAEQKFSPRSRVPMAARPGVTSGHPTNVERGLEGAEHSTNVGRGLEGAERSTGKVHLPKARLVREAGRDVGRLAELGVKFKALRIGANAWRATRWISGVALMMFIPMTPLDFAFEIAMAISDAYHEKEEREQRRKDLALAAVLNDPKLDLAGLIATRVTSSAGYDTLLTLWDTHPDQTGFVYARISAVLEVQSLRTYGIEQERVTKYTAVAIKVYPSYSYYPFELTQLGAEEDISDAEKERLLKMYAPDEELAIRSLVPRGRRQRLQLKYTIVPPAITPFDVVLTKVNNLFLDLLYFVAQFENLGERLRVGITRFDYSGSYEDMIGWELQYPAPLRRATCEYCLGYLHWTGKMLSSHPLNEVDLYGTLENPIRGWRRRHAILLSLLEGQDTQYGKNFAYFAEQMKDLVGSRGKDPEISAAVTELYIGAAVVLADLRRLYRNEKSPEFFYYGSEYKPPK